LCGCFGFRISAGPLLDSRGNVGADARVDFAFEIRTRSAGEFAIVGGAGGGLLSGAPVGVVESSVDYTRRISEDSRFALRGGLMTSSYFGKDLHLVGVGGRFGVPYTLSREGGRLFGSEEKGFGRSGSSVMLGPEIDIHYAFGRFSEDRVMFSPRVVFEGHMWIDLSHE
jgi:hypothetical protein